MLQMRGFKIHWFNLCIAQTGQKKRLDWARRASGVAQSRPALCSAQTALLKQGPLTGQGEVSADHIRWVFSSFRKKNRIRTISKIQN